MTIENRTTVKTYFQTGDKPSQDQFENFIDSAIFYEDTSNFGRQLVSASSATSARNLLGVGTVGNNLFTATTTASAQNELGGKTVGKILFETNTTASAQTEIGGGVVGRQIFEATTTASATNIILQPATPTIQGISYLMPNRNFAINGNFNINQRVVSGTVSLSAGSYGHDRWKAGASGCTYTFSTTNNITTITISAGSLIQVIEGNNLVSDTYCLSWTGTAQGKIGAGSYGSSGITGSATGETDLNIEFNTGTLSLVQFEKNLAPTPFEHRFYNNELTLCQRYYYKTFPQATAPAQNAGVDGAFLFGNPATSAPGVFTPNLRFPVSMRTNPTITLYNPSATNAQIRNVTNSSDFSGSAAQNVSIYGLNFTGTSSGSQGQSCAIHITATAEI